MQDEEPTLTRRQSRRHKLRAKQAAAREAERRAANSAPLLETPADIKIWQELQNNPAWKIPPEAFEQAPKAFLAIGTDTSLKPGERTQALNGLAKLVGQNQAAKKHEASFTFSVQQYQGRHTLAETPEPDDEPTENNTVDAVGYTEKVSLTESADVIRELKTLGHLEKLLGYEADDPSAPEK